MPTHSSYDYAIVRVVPRVEREEFINAGVILSCPAQDFLGARIELDERRLLALDARVDIEEVRANLASIPAGVRGRRRGRSDRQVIAARALSLAGRAAQHHHPDFAGSLRSLPGSAGSAGSSGADDGEGANVAHSFERCVHCLR